MRRDPWPFRGGFELRDAVLIATLALLLIYLSGCAFDSVEGASAALECSRYVLHEPAPREACAIYLASGPEVFLFSPATESLCDAVNWACIPAAPGERVTLAAPLSTLVGDFDAYVLESPDCTATCADARAALRGSL